MPQARNHRGGRRVKPRRRGSFASLRPSGLPTVLQAEFSLRLNALAALGARLPRARSPAAVNPLARVLCSAPAPWVTAAADRAGNALAGQPEGWPAIYYSRVRHRRAAPLSRRSH